MYDIKEMIKDVKNKTVVRFKCYRDGNLWYSTETGFLFPVPVNDVGTAEFLAEDKIMYFQRYIRKFIDVLNAEKAAVSV